MPRGTERFCNVHSVVDNADCLVYSSVLSTVTVIDLPAIVDTIL